jgi:uncharacterized protein
LTALIDFNKTRIDFDVRVPMRDGVTLSADIYRPAEPGHYPVLLYRTPYNKNNADIPPITTRFTSLGFVVVFIDVRGRGDSDGEFTPYRNDGIDGYDAVEWCAAQPWSSGNVGTIGNSYLGRIQWLTALLRPPHLKAMSVSVTPADPFVETPTGTPSPMHLCWCNLVSGRLRQNVDIVDWAKVYEHLPMLTMDVRAGRFNPFWREDMQHTQFDAYWDAISYQNRLDQIDVPVLHITGWYDDEQVGTPMNFVGMTAKGRTEHARANQKLLVGPWDHRVNSKSKLGEVDFGPTAIIDLQAYQARWFKRWLAEEDNGITGELPVRIFVMGVNQWRDEREWPLARTAWTPYYLHSGGNANSRYGDGLLSTAAPADELPDRYCYDPARPVPFLTEPTSFQIGGPDDYAAVEQRADVLVYTTPPLKADLEITGPIRVTLYAASSAVDTDFMAKVVDVWPSGFAQRLCDGMVRARFREGMSAPNLIEPGRIYEYTIDCWNTSVVLRKGHAIRLEIASSAFPKYDRNLNTGAPLGTTSEFLAANQVIYHDAAHPSHVLLPVIPSSDRD